VIRCTLPAKVFRQRGGKTFIQLGFVFSLFGLELPGSLRGEHGLISTPRPERSPAAGRSATLAHKTTSPPTTSNTRLLLGLGKSTTDLGGRDGEQLEADNVNKTLISV